MRKILLVALILGLTAVFPLSCKPFPTTTATPAAMATVRTTWNVRWMTVQYLQYAAQFVSEVGGSQFPSTFSYDWADGTLYDGYSDWVGFQATAKINMQRQGGGSVTFTVGCDDGARLYLDGNIIIDDWSWGSYRSHNVTVNLTPGKHTLMLEYWEGYVLAEVSFYCDPDILEWQE